MSFTWYKDSPLRFFPFHLYSILYPPWLLISPTFSHLHWIIAFPSFDLSVAPPAFCFTLSPFLRPQIPSLFFLPFPQTSSHCPSPSHVFFSIITLLNISPPSFSRCELLEGSKFFPRHQSASFYFIRSAPFHPPKGQNPLLLVLRAASSFDAFCDVPSTSLFGYLMICRPSFCAFDLCMFLAFAFLRLLPHNCRAALRFFLPPISTSCFLFFCWYIDNWCPPSVQCPAVFPPPLIRPIIILFRGFQRQFFN